MWRIARPSEQTPTPFISVFEVKRILARYKCQLSLESLKTLLFTGGWWTLAWYSCERCHGWVSIPRVHQWFWGKKDFSPRFVSIKSRNPRIPKNTFFTAEHYPDIYMRRRSRPSEHTPFISDFEVKIILAPVHSLYKPSVHSLNQIWITMETVMTYITSIHSLNGMSVKIT